MISVGLARDLASRLEKPLGAICEGRVGADGIDRSVTIGSEWPRLARCSSSTVLSEHSGRRGRVYDRRHPNDRLLLGTKGTMSEMNTYCPGG